MMSNEFRHIEEPGFEKDYVVIKLRKYHR
jgi:hypothetical protein